MLLSLGTAPLWLRSRCTLQRCSFLQEKLLTLYCPAFNTERTKAKRNRVALAIHIYIPKYMVWHHHTLWDPLDVSHHQPLWHYFKIRLQVSVIKYGLKVKHPFHYDGRCTLLCIVAMVTDLVAIRFTVKCIPKSFLVLFFGFFIPSCMVVSNYGITKKT